MTRIKKAFIMNNVSGRRNKCMFKLIISNDNLTTTEFIEDFKGVMELIKVFKKRYGEPIFMQVLLLNENEKDVDSD